MRDLFKFGKEKAGYFIIALTLIVILGMTRGYIPIVVRYIVDSILGSEAPAVPSWFVNLLYREDLLAHLFMAALSLVIVAFARGLLMVLNAYFRAEFAEGVAEYLRNRVYNHINHLSYTYHNNADTGDLIQRSTTDIDTIKTFLKDHLSSLAWISSMAISVIIQMLFIDVLLTVVSLIVLPVTIALSVYYFKKMAKVFDQVEKSEAALTTTVQENLNGVRVVKAFNREAFEIEKFNEKNEDYRLESIKMYRHMSNYWSTSDAITLTQYAMTLGIGTIFAVNGLITLGETLAFIMLVQIVVWPIRNLGRIISEYSKTKVSIDRLNEILEVEDEYQENGELETPIKGKIQFENVGFKFEDGENSLLNDVSFTINSGETIALIGKTGSGKSTLIKLLIRLLDHQTGSIKVDDVDIRRYEKKYLRSNFGVILQEPFLFSRTVSENIGIMLTDDNENKIKEAAALASISNDIQKFENGYETMVGEKGVTLSGGQKQRVAIARVLVKNHPIMIFDDSLSALDTETDLAIREALKSTNRETTTIIITHRITTAMEADRIMILDDGSIVENDTHDNLIKRDGLYKNLYEIQTGLEKTLKGGDR